MIDWAAYRTRLADQLCQGGYLRAPAWLAAFLVTPRHVFVPRFYAPDEYMQPRTVVDGDDPATRERWREAVYSDEVLVTRYEVAGTMPDGREVHVPSSSAPMPQVVAAMLEELDVRDEHRVLEIGTGTGYTTALLAHRLGDSNITSVELDPGTAAEAGQHLAAAGHRPFLVVGDGAAGFASRAPYDRIIATCAVSTVPPAWVEQLTDDGAIVAPLTFGDALAVLRRAGKDEVCGRISHQRVAFMPLRRPGQSLQPPQIPKGGSDSRHATTDLDETTWDDPNWRLWLALHLPQAHYAEQIDDGGARTGVLVYTAAACATVDYTAGGPGAWHITPNGGRLWDAVETAWHSWRHYDQPARTRIGITAHADGDQYAWLDDPDGPRWPLTTAARS